MTTVVRDARAMDRESARKIDLNGWLTVEGNPIFERRCLRLYGQPDSWLSW